jgi:D-alanyl-D-alanine carboxypeptidase
MRRALLAVVALVAVLATPVQASSADAPAAPRIAAASWYLVGEDGDVLARGDAAQARAIASITKLMTAVVVLEHAGLDDVVRVSPLALRSRVDRLLRGARRSRSPSCSERHSSRARTTPLRHSRFTSAGDLPIASSTS